MWCGGEASADGRAGGVRLEQAGFGRLVLVNLGAQRRDTRDVGGGIPLSRYGLGLVGQLPPVDCSLIIKFEDWHIASLLD